MYFSKKHSYWFLFLGILTLGTFVLNLSLGSVNIAFNEVLNSFINPKAITESHYLIITSYRLPKAITAILVGSGLGVAGLLMQTFFRNPLAGPYVLGLSSGASLGVALLILGSSSLNLFTNLTHNKWSYALFAALGCITVLTGVMMVSSKVKNSNAILIVGLMFSSIASAIVSILSFFASQSELQQYVFWGFGNLGNLSWEEIRWFTSIYIIGIGIGLFSIKALNGLLLGESYAKSLGHNIKRNRVLIIIATSLLTGAVTAFSGPIAFIGLAIPYITKQIFGSSNHKIIFPGVLLIGSIVMLLCDAIAQFPNNELILPINAITALVGAPVVIILLLKSRKINF